MTLFRKGPTVLTTDHESGLFECCDQSKIIKGKSSKMSTNKPALLPGNCCPNPPISSCSDLEVSFEASVITEGQALDFAGDVVNTGATRDYVFGLANLNTGDITVSAINITGSIPGDLLVTILESLPFTITGLATTTFTIRVDATSATIDEDATIVIDIQSDACNAPNTFSAKFYIEELPVFIFTTFEGDQVTEGQEIVRSIQDSETLAASIYNDSVGATLDFNSLTFGAVEYTSNPDHMLALGLMADFSMGFTLPSLNIAPGVQIDSDITFASVGFPSSNAPVGLYRVPIIIATNAANSPLTGYLVVDYTSLRIAFPQMTINGDTLAIYGLSEVKNFSLAGGLNQSLNFAITNTAGTSPLIVYYFEIAPGSTYISSVGAGQSTPAMLPVLNTTFASPLAPAGTATFSLNIDFSTVPPGQFLPVAGTAYTTTLRCTTNDPNSTGTFDISVDIIIGA